jgi:hypothetical protein
MGIFGLFLAYTALRSNIADIRVGLAAVLLGLRSPGRSAAKRVMIESLPSPAVNYRV